MQPDHTITSGARTGVPAFRVKTVREAAEEPGPWPLTTGMMDPAMKADRDRRLIPYADLAVRIALKRRS
jgi:hypothetical protein